MKHNCGIIMVFGGARYSPEFTRNAAKSLRLNEPDKWEWVEKYQNDMNRLEGKFKDTQRHHWQYYWGRPSSLCPVVFKCSKCDLNLELFDGHISNYEDGESGTLYDNPLPRCMNAKMRKALK